MLTRFDPFSAHELVARKVRQRDGSGLQSCSTRKFLELLPGEKQFLPKSSFGAEERT